MKVLVTGSAGMLARATIRVLEQGGHELVGIDLEDADVTQLDSLMHPTRTFRPDWIFHLAAFTKVDDCETQANTAHLVNGLGTRNAALAAAAINASLLTISTDYVFGGNASRPYREYDPAAPASVYGASKWAGEQAVREVYARHIIVRTAWLYGRGGPNFPDTILRKAGEGGPLKVVNDQRGSPTWTKDLAGALLKLAATEQYGTYHVTNSGECTWYDFACYLVSHAGLDVSIEPTDSATFARPAPRPAYSVLSNLAYEHVTGDRMPHWQDAADRYLKSKEKR